MDLALAGKMAIITGGSEGIGRAAARSLGREGARVVVCARREAVLRRAADVAQETGAEIVPIVADVSTAAGVERLVTAEDCPPPWRHWSPLQRLTALRAGRTLRQITKTSPLTPGTGH